MSRALRCVAIALIVVASCAPTSTPTIAPKPRPAALHTAPPPDQSQSEPEVVDVGVLAAGNGVVFVHLRDGCEAWQFIDDGARLERIDDQSLDLRLSFAVAVRGVDGLTLTDPRGGSRGENVTLDCPEEAPNNDTLYAEEAECQGGVRPIAIKRGCPSVLLAQDRREEILHRLEAQRSAALDVGRQRAPALLAALNRAMTRSNAVYWPARSNTAGGCERWVARKGTLVHKTDDGTAVSYTVQPRLNPRTGIAEVSMTGPEWSGPRGEGGIGSWGLEPITEVTDDHAIVGDHRWYFSQQACDDATQQPSP